MDVSSLGYRTDLALLRLGGSLVEDRGDHLVVRSPHNPTHWWGNFLLVDGVLAPAAGPDWLDRFAAAFPGADHVALGFDAPAGTVDDLAWSAGWGCTPEAQAVMTASTVRPPSRVAEGVVCRPLAGDDDWAASTELRIRCNDRPIPAGAFREYATREVATNRSLVEAGHGDWWGAFTDGHLVGQLGLVATGGGLARYRSVETDPDHRRRGVAGSLVHRAAVHALGPRGATTLVMVADPDYFAIDLYRALGFRETERQLQVERAPVTAAG